MAVKPIHFKVFWKESSSDFLYEGKKCKITALNIRLGEETQKLYAKIPRNILPNQKKVLKFTGPGLENDCVRIDREATDIKIVQIYACITAKPIEVPVKMQKLPGFIPGASYEITVSKENNELRAIFKIDISETDIENEIQDCLKYYKFIEIDEILEFLPDDENKNRYIELKQNALNEWFEKYKSKKIEEAKLFLNEISSYTPLRISTIGLSLEEKKEKFVINNGDYIQQLADEAELIKIGIMLNGIEGFKANFFS